MAQGKLKGFLLWAGLAAPAIAGILPVQNVVTNLDELGDRQFISAGFVGSPTVFDHTNIGNFVDGRLNNNIGLYGYVDPIARDMSITGNAMWANPDRADISSPFPLEGSEKATIADVFSNNNLSWIIDGEGTTWTMDLFFAPGELLFGDGDETTVELAVFERGGNSDVGVRGIYELNGQLMYTDGVRIMRDQFGLAGWTLDTLEIDNAQEVVGVGLDLDQLGDVSHGLIGIQLYSEAGFNGPDIVGVLNGGTVPEPTSLGLLLVGLAGVLGRVRNRS